MSTYRQALVGIQVPLDEADAQARILISALQARQVIASEPLKTDDNGVVWFNDAPGVTPYFQFGPDLESQLARGYSAGNGIGIGVGWQTGTPGFSDPELYCPRCTWLHEFALTIDSLNSFAEKRNLVDMHCHICDYRGPLNAWRIVPAFSQGHLALHFEDYPQLTDFGARELLQLIGGEVRYTFGKW